MCRGQSQEDHLLYLGMWEPKASSPQGRGGGKDWAQEGGSMVSEHTEHSAWDMEGLGDPVVLSVGERRHKFRLAGRWLGCGCMSASH